MAKKSWSRVLEGTGGAGSVYGAGSVPGKRSQLEASAGKQGWGRWRSCTSGFCLREC